MTDFFEKKNPPGIICLVLGESLGKPWGCNDKILTPVQGRAKYHFVVLGVLLDHPSNRCDR